MPIKTSFLNEEHLRQLPLPTHGKRYAVVPHGTIIDKTREELSAAGFGVISELYRASLDGQIAQGSYQLHYGDDSDMGLMFAWSNSYNKMMRFKCAVGAQVFICMNGVVHGDLGNYNRKHIGANALTDVFTTINTQISKAKEHYDQLVTDKEMLKNVTLTTKDKGRILGELFAHDEILTLTQVGIVKREIDKPSFNYNSDVDSAWTMYNHITLALKESHPMTYIDDHQKVHSFFVKQYGSPIASEVVQPTPLDVKDQPIKPIKDSTVFKAHSSSLYGVNFV